MQQKRTYIVTGEHGPKSYREISEQRAALSYAMDHHPGWYPRFARQNDDGTWQPYVALTAIGKPVIVTEQE